ncbi:MAG: amidohydrolase [Candidatus Binatia bacterium]
MRSEASDPTVSSVPAVDHRRGADLVLHNARVLTFDRTQSHADLVAVRGDRILAVATADDLPLFARPGVTLLDCEGATLIPGFNDAHCHPLALAINLLSVDCSPASVHSIAELEARIRQRAGQTVEGAWIRAVGYDDARLAEGRAPTRWELDRAAPRHPVVLVHATGQSCVLNSAALHLAGIATPAPDAAAGGICRDSRSGEPTGLVSGRQDRVARAIPAPDADEIERGMALANRTYLAQGITSLQDTSWTNGWRHWQLWQRLVVAAVAPRVAMMVGTESLDRFRDAGLATGSGDSRLRLGALKLALDESTGVRHPPRDEVESLALRAHEAGFQVAFHVSDIRMLEVALAAIAVVRAHCARRAHHACDAVGFRLEHCAICPPRLLSRVRASRAMVVTQPAFVRGFGARYTEDAAAHQIGWFCPIGSLRRHDIAVAFGSDSPLVSSDPLAGIHAAVTRRTDTGRSVDPRQAITALDALEMYTIAGAQASLEADEKGSISPGKLADLALLDRDPTRIAAEELPAVKVLRTIVGGRVVWQG